MRFGRNSAIPPTSDGIFSSKKCPAVFKMSTPALSAAETSDDMTGMFFKDASVSPCIFEESLVTSSRPSLYKRAASR